MTKTTLNQSQTLTQTQTLTPQQLLVAQLLEMPANALRERVEVEMMENPTLETDDRKDDIDALELGEAERSTNLDTMDDRLADYANADDIPDYLLHQANNEEEREPRVWGQNQSFHQMLKEQIGYFDLDQHQQQLLEYLIGSLNDDGLLTTPLQQIADELEVYHNIQATLPQLQHALGILQNFEPAGVGARNLRECLLLQVQHAPDRHTPIKQLLATLLQEHFDLLMLKRWDRIQQRMHLTDIQVQQLQHQIHHLNPRPGSAMDETVSTSTANGSPFSLPSSSSITPDFIAETDSYGNVTLSLNQNDIPPLRVSPDDIDFIQTHTRQPADTLTRTERDGLLYIRSKVQRAQQFITALQQRNDNMLKTMRAIIQLQQSWFQSGDDMQLRPMKLEDVASRTGLALSTISRVSNSKYVQTTFGTYPLRWFFTTKAQLNDDQVSVRNIQNTLRQLIDNEPPDNPHSDDTLTQLLNQHGYKVARRTVAKYRQQMNIPVARLRKS